MSKILKLSVGILISGLCLWLALRNVTFEQILETYSNVNEHWLFLAFIVFNLNVYLKGWRWKFVLTPIHQIGVLPCYYLTCIGGLMNNILPARMGDVLRGVFLRKYAFSRIEGIATVLLERVLDTGTLMLFFCGIILFVGLPIEIPAYMKMGAMWLGAITIFFLVFFYWWINNPTKADHFLDKVQKIVPTKLRPLLDKFVGRINVGFVVLSRPAALLRIMGLNILIWLSDALVPMFLLYAFNISLPYHVALFLLIVVAISTIVPAAPGFVGVFQYVSVLFLVPYGIEKAQAVGFSLAWNLGIYLNMSLLGFLGIWLEKISLTDIRSMLRFSKARP